MVKYCDLAICDSVNIEKYIHECYDGKGIKGKNPKTTFIAYGADLTLSKLADDDEKLVNWYKEKGLTKKDYYLVVGRFVPENSFEVMIREFMKSKSKKDFAIITNVNDKFLNELEKKLHFKSDKRIKFVGTVYDQELLKKIRENAYAYFHGHTVGGTNPSLIEALGSTDLNLLVDVGFNKEVAEDCALYWSRKPGSLAKLIDKADKMCMNYGWKILAADLSGTFFDQLRSLIVGKAYTSADLAFYNKGNQLPSLITTNISSSIMTVLFPAIANMFKIKTYFYIREYYRKGKKKDL